MPVSVTTNASAKSSEKGLSRAEQLVANAINRAKQLREKQVPWHDQWQLIGEFIHLIKQEFQNSHQVGEFLTREIFDSAAPKASKIAASTLVSLLWPQTKNRMKTNPPRTLEGTKEEKEYYEFVAYTILRVMDDPKAGFALATDEYMLDQVNLGTSATEIMSDKEVKVRFTPWGVKHMCIGEGKYGRVDTVYISLDTDVDRLVKDYGLENVSPKTREAFNDGKFDQKRKLLIAIEPRITKMQGTVGNKDMPFQSVHIEEDCKHLLRESGFEELPIIVTRLIKLLGETYGRSLAMDAMPVILERNSTKEATTIAIEKSLDPPLGVYSDGILGGGEIDTSAGAINVFNPSDQAKDRQPIFPLNTVGEFRQVGTLLQDQGEEISNHFLVDRLLDFNNETRMTATETTLRDRMRNATLGQIFNRQINEYFTPCIERVFRILLADGHLGVKAGDPRLENQPNLMIIPDTVVELMESGEDVFDLEYFTPAKRIMQSEEAEAILRTVEHAGQYVELGKEGVLDNINEDKSLEIYAGIVGAPSEMFNSKEEINKIREAKAAAAEDARMQEQAGAVAEATRNIGQSGLFPTTAPVRNE
jgi:hypothetical protein